MMKKLFVFAVMIVMLATTISTTSCSTAKSVNSAFAKNGYTMGVFTPAQQAQLAPVMSSFPAFSYDAMGYLQTANATTFVYAVDEAAWNTYCNTLVGNGFSNMGIGFVKADKGRNITYNVSGKFTTIYKQTYLLVTYTYSGF